MTGARVLADAVLALYPTDVRVHDGQVVAGDGETVPTPPWVHVTVTLPNVTERSLARPGHVQTVRVRSLVYGLNATAVRVVADKLAPLEGARPVAAGWSTSPLEVVNTRDVVEDRDVKVTGTNRHPMYGVVEHLFTASMRAQ